MVKDQAVIPIQTNETFVVGEWVDYLEGEYRMKVEVVSVQGIFVTAIVDGAPVTFSPREIDGKFVKIGSAYYEVMPTMIYHSTPAPVKPTAWKRFLEFFKK